MDRQHHGSKRATLSEFPKARPEEGGFSELPTEMFSLGPPPGFLESVDG